MFEIKHKIGRDGRLHLWSGSELEACIACGRSREEVGIPGINFGEVQKVANSSSQTKGQKMRYLIVFGMLMAIGCNKPAVRDSGVYKAELEFIDDATRETVENGKAVLAQQCKCFSPVEDVLVFETVECDKLATTILVIEARMPYHTSYMRYLGGISDVRPNEKPPVVPAVGTLCVKE